MGDLGPHPGQKRDREGRLAARALRGNWAPDDETLDKLRKRVEGVVLTSPDDRAIVLAYRALLEADVAVVNSINQIAGVEGSEVKTTEARPEPIDPE